MPRKEMKILPFPFIISILSFSLVLMLYVCYKEARRAFEKRRKGNYKIILLPSRKPKG